MPKTSVRALLLLLLAILLAPVSLSICAKAMKAGLGWDIRLGHLIVGSVICSPILYLRFSKLGRFVSAQQDQHQEFMSSLSPEEASIHSQEEFFGAINMILLFPIIFYVIYRCCA